MENSARILRISKIVLGLLEDGAKTHGELIDTVVSRYQLSEKQMSDRNVNSKLNVIRSQCGNVITSLLHEGSIDIDASGYYHLAKEKPIIVDEIRCEQETLKLISEAPRTRNKLLQILKIEFRVTRTKSRTDDRLLEKTLDLILERLTESGRIELRSDRYFLIRRFTSSDPDDIKRRFLARLCSMGGAFFERYFVTLMAKYYTAKKMTVCSADVIGGSDDGGIDGIIVVTDALGFRETVMMQMKCRKNIQATEKEIREFYGSVCCKKGTRGIFATTSSFHEGAIKTLALVDNCVGVDGDKLFEIAMLCEYGLHKDKKKVVLDESVFEF